MSLLAVNDLSIRYADTTVVDSLSFQIEQGESVGLVGGSGSGKSQTALAIMGLVAENAVLSGEILLNGENLAQQDMNSIRAQRIAMIFQDPMQALNPYIRVGRQLAEILLQHGLATRRTAKSRVLKSLQRVGLPDVERQFAAYPHQLSGGMRQRVMIASALIAGPDLLIADEPTTALDVTVQAQILDLLEEVREETALLLITHDLGVVAGRCERLLVMQHGKLVESGATTTVFSAPKTAYTRSMLEDAPRIDRGVIRESSHAETLLTVDNLSVSYDSNSNVVREVSMALRDGETLAVVGESGSGKSSLVRSILGLVAPQSGQVVFAGSTLPGAIRSRAIESRRDLQLIFQDPASSLNPQMRVRSLVGEALLVHSPQLSSQQRTVAVSDALEQVGLSDSYLERYPHQLSGGEAQRVAIARALAVKPRVLICDEAVAALDGVARSKVLDVLQAAQEEMGLSLIFISHDLSVVRAISHRVAVMYLGRLVEVAPTTDLFSVPRHPYSKALLDASPVPDPTARPHSVALQGEIPSPLKPPAGCVFHSRCGHAIDKCGTTRPSVAAIGRSQVACHRAEELDLVFRL